MVTISRQLGSGGEETARLLAEELGWKLLDNAVVERLLVERGFPSAEVETYTERKPDLWHRLSAEKAKYLHFLKMASYEFARQGSCVVLGRGGQILFANVPGIVRVRMVAPLQDRIGRMLSKFGGDERLARLAVQHADNERAGFYRCLFHTDWDCPDLYDLTINTHSLSAQTAAELIRKALGSREITEKKREAARKLEDLYLAQKAIVAILYEQKLPIHFLEIEADDGAITLKGTARDHPSIDRCRDEAAKVFPAGKIDNQICFEPKYVEILAGLHRGAAEERSSSAMKA